MHEVHHAQIIKEIQEQKENEDLVKLEAIEKTQKEHFDEIQKQIKVT
jgi:hypothetical protein